MVICRADPDISQDEIAKDVGTVLAELEIKDLVVEAGNRS